MMPPPQQIPARAVPASASHLAGLASLAARHAQAFWYVLTVLLPAIIRTGKRPVIFSKFSGIGDIICTVPAALELKKRHAGHEIIYNCFADYSCVPRLGGVTNHVTSLGASIGVVGYWYGFLLDSYYNFASEDDFPVDHTKLYVWEFGSRFGVDIEGDHPRLRMDPVVIDRVRALLAHHGIDAEKAPMIVIHPGPTLPVREWPHECWVSFVQELRRHGFKNIVQLGVGKVMRFGTAEISAVPGVTPMVNALTLEESIALIALADLFVGVDSGLLHAAVSVGTPSVGMWGATSPRFRFSPGESKSFVVSGVECQGCHHRHPVLHWDTGCPYDIRCMKSITVEEVLQSCLSRLAVDVTGKELPSP